MTEITPPAFFYSRQFRLVCGLALIPSLIACNGLSQMVRPELQKVEPVVAEQPPTTPETVTGDQKTPPPEEPIKEIKLKPSALFEWNGNGRHVSRIVVDTDKQKARFYAGETEIGWSMVATGVSNYPTPTGQFNVLEKVENKRSNLYGKVVGRGGSVVRTNAKMGRDRIPEGSRFEGAHMPFFMRLTGDGVGLHAGPIPNPGQPASHGCIRMPSQLAPVLFNHVSIGTSVSITGGGPSYGNYAAKQRAANAQQVAQQTAQANERRRIEANKAKAAAAAREARARRIAAAKANKPATIAKVDVPAASSDAAVAVNNQTPNAVAPTPPTPSVAPQQPTPPVAATPAVISDVATPVKPAPAPAAPVNPTPPPAAPAPTPKPEPAPVAPVAAPAPVAPPAPAPAPKPEPAPAPAPETPPTPAAPAQ
ncbi:L,D-transpeptidase [Chromatium okenii]|uniref:L,D-TPase catalytic domain-containing protein n=1 Tax=Chromatium okenii TaxID=61644 RepID=A0A2S7XU53_9GAMM|nr:L,D-transpeptidase [Chromatium okenii]PQJ97053.1 hypothetical protein CXB77_03450 [Chromatium okenii]